MNPVYLSILFMLFAFFTMKYKSKNKVRILLESAFILLFGMITLAYIVINHFTGDGINHAVLSTMNLGIWHAGFGDYALLIVLSLFAFIFLFVIAYFYHVHLDRVKQVKPKKIKAFLHNGFLILAFLTHPFFKDIYVLYQDLTVKQSSDFYTYYKTPTNANNKENNKNLVYIYLEAFEKTYFNEQLFPQLAPNLNRLIKKNGLEFTNIHQVSGTEFTIAGIVSTQCGIPLFTTSDKHVQGQSMGGMAQFYPKAICMGDILKSNDYYLSYMQGATLKFAGKNKFFATHKYDNMQGREELEKHLQDKAYISGWGLYDDTLLDLVYKEFIELSKKKEKFALFTLTLDTHFPDGKVARSCNNDLYKNGDNPILNAYQCSDKIVSQFISKIQQSPYAKNTVIVIGSDHLAMRNTASDLMPNMNERKNLFVIFDEKIKKYSDNNSSGTPFDVGPTVLSRLGIHTNIGLGRDLLAEDSLFASFKNINRKLGQWRDEILSFWDFPKLPDTIHFALNSLSAEMGKQKIAYPVLIKINDNNTIHPFFQEYSEVTLYNQLLSNLKTNDRFLWIDYCANQNYIFSDTPKQSTYCLSQGLHGKVYETTPINPGENYQMKAFENLSSSYDTMDHIRQRIVKLNELKKSLFISKIKEKNVVKEKMIFNLSSNQYEKNEQLTLSVRDKYIELNAINTAPIIILNQTQSKAESVILSCEIESPQNTEFQLFYKVESYSPYDEGSSYKVNLVKGNNKIDLLIPSRFINNGLRVDMVSHIGKYNIKKFEIYDQ